MRISRMLAVFFAAGTALVSWETALRAAPPAAWTPRGIGGGGAMFSPTINPSNPKEMALACDMSPQFTTLDAGKSWTLTNFRQLQSGREGAIRFTRDPLIRWTINYSPAGGDDRARPARTIDGGKTWFCPPEHAWPSARKAYVLYADYDNPDRAVITADYGELWITLDGGRTFAKKITGVDNDAGLHLAGAFFDGQNIILALNDGLYTSTDGGKNFALAETPGLFPGGFIASFTGAKANGKTCFYCVSLRKGWAGITGGEFNEYAGVYVMNAGDHRWQRKTAGIPANVSPFFVAMAANDPDTAYVAGGRSEGRSGPAVYKTTDAGTSWTDVFHIEGNKNITAGWVGDGGDHAWSFPEFALGFDVCRSDKNFLLLTDLSCAHASSDGGKTWRQVYTTPTTPRHAGLIDPGQTYASNGIEVTSIWQVLWFDKDNLFVCATDIRGFRSTDGGKSWSFNYTGDTFNSMYSAVTDPVSKTTFAGVSSVHDFYESTYLQDKKIDKAKGGVLATSDAGATWTPVGNLAKPVVWVAIDPHHSARLYASVVNNKDGGIYLCEDPAKGSLAAWTKLPAPPRTEGHPYNIHLLNDGAILCTYSGRRDGNIFTPSSGVFLSTDNGQTWDDRTDFRMRFWTKDIVLDPADKTQNTWYACVFHAWGKSAREGEEGLYRTTDRGKTWTQIVTAPLAQSGVLNVESCAFDPVHDGQFYITTEYDGLFYCPDIRSPHPLFKPVESYGFKHPMRIEFNPFRQTEMWVTSFGNAIQVGETTP